MRTIVLASKSKARKAVLKQAGIKFKCAFSRVKERRVLKKRCADLVIENALLKALDVASRFKKGIIIGADTVVLAGNKIIGKPKSMKDAVKTLKTLSRKPQWVYTGLAIFDIDNNKIYKDYEKTKIYMYRMGEREIKNYFKNTSPFDKAGSFDIQGKGALFIDRIEGCFYNVVGLPLAKLAKLLKKAGVGIFKGR